MSRELVFETLDRMGISYETVNHPPVYTIEEMDKLGLFTGGAVCKNLFLRDAKGRRHFLVSLQKDKQADLRKLSEALETSRLSFASEERLMRYLKLSKGAVTPFGILNDEGREVEVVFDEALSGEKRLGVHPNVNTETVWIACEDLRRVIEAHGNPFRTVPI
ncbi:prolyl-tRNA synthetase associated domain-containing protein [Papillibacter cinnamivorans]|uniref:Ala-tRNA(Pro) deacylase n=1 Tax=Papillibacter cinnamivorans DSM 12816 TaxID=1122930 RepID=A0A1W2BV45_9FIRM|nr:prolyl-tRNA synthetase associated domain-containing protein [Papillibacter cinnamivorans]SMC76596.1 Ala-tRNA(Pro) deacylase [Papillibacter cinnamivorans DSM 12816]